jgi:alpha-L-fucosidase
MRYGFVLWLIGSLCCGLPAEGGYEPKWESLENYDAPEWYKDAKFGIWPHWGVYSVPAFRGDHASEWYGRWMYLSQKDVDKNPKHKRGMKTAEHHRKTYGDPSEFGYKDFIPLFTAEHFDADEWAQLVVDSGARFFTMMGMHHDSFGLGDSEYTEWCAAKMGPRRDLIGEMAAAVRRRGLKFGVSNHMAWNRYFFEFNHKNGCDAADPRYHGLYSEGALDGAYLENWWKRTTELVHKYRPDLYWFDWGWHKKEFEKHRLKFAAYYYNDAIKRGLGTVGDPGVVLNSKYKPMSKICVLDLERKGMQEVQELTWQNDTSISKSSWGYCTDDEYRTADQLIDTLLDASSKNGVMLLNFGPMADGTIPDEYRKPLLGMGAWLKQNGEAIYYTRPYVVFGEGPTIPGKNMHGDEVNYTAEDIRFSRNKENTVLYATLLDWPESGQVKITRMGKGAFNASSIREVRLLGGEGEVKWAQDESGLNIQLPQKPGYGYAYPVKFTFDGLVPGVRR